VSGEYLPMNCLSEDENDVLIDSYGGVHRNTDAQQIDLAASGIAGVADCVHLRDCRRETVA
jgi:hypothetical protein